MRVNPPLHCLLLENTQILLPDKILAACVSPKTGSNFFKIKHIKIFKRETVIMKFQDEAQASDAAALTPSE